MNELTELDAIADKVLAYRPAKQNQQKGEHMDRDGQVEINGKMYQLVEVDFEVAEENWNRYNLLDGGVIRARQSPYRISRVVDEDGNPFIGPDGRPVFYVEWSQQIVRWSRGMTGG